MTRGEPSQPIVEVIDRQELVAVAREPLVRAAMAVLVGEGRGRAEVNLVVVDDGQIERLNREFLQHDYPTDVLSFALESSPQRLEGEVIVSAETARARALELGCDVEDELLLYVIHGVLHLCGHDDQDDSGRRRMREREAHYLELVRSGETGPARPRGQAGPEGPGRER